MLHTTPQRLLSRHEVGLVLITAVWGATFLIVHIAVQYSGPWFFVGMRFLTAGVISALVFARILRSITLKEIVAGSAIGVMIFFGYGLQTVGLQTINSSTSAFITALYVPLVPILQWLVFRKPPRLLTWIGVGLAFVGLVLLADPGQVGFTFGSGEITTLVATIPIAAEIILIGWFAGKVDLGRVTVVQLLAAGLLGLLAMPVVGEELPAFSWVWVGAAVALGAASCLIQLTMNWAQRSVSPTRATIIYAAEPVWAAIIGRIAGDRLPPVAIAGAVLIVGGALVSELKFRKRENLDIASHPSHSDDYPSPSFRELERTDRRTPRRRRTRLAARRDPGVERQCRGDVAAYVCQLAEGCPNSTRSVERQRLPVESGIGSFRLVSRC